MPSAMHAARSTRKPDLPGQGRWVRPAGIEPATKCLEGGRRDRDARPAPGARSDSRSCPVRDGPAAHGQVAVTAAVRGASGLRACPHSCRAFRRWMAVKAAHAAGRRPGLGLGLDRRPAAVRTIGRWEGLPGREGKDRPAPVGSSAGAVGSAATSGVVGCRGFHRPGWATGVATPGLAAFLHGDGGDDEGCDGVGPRPAEGRVERPGRAAARQTGRCTAGSAWSRLPPTRTPARGRPAVGRPTAPA